MEKAEPLKLSKRIVIITKSNCDPFYYECQKTIRLFSEKGRDIEREEIVGCDALRDLVPFVQFKKREKHPWRSVTFSKVADF